MTRLKPHLQAPCAALPWSSLIAARQPAAAQSSCHCSSSAPLLQCCPPPVNVTLRNQDKVFHTSVSAWHVFAKHVPTLHSRPWGNSKTSFVNCMLLRVTAGLINITTTDIFHCLAILQSGGHAKPGLHLLPCHCCKYLAKKVGRKQ